MDRPILQLTNFTGMDNGPVYYLEGLAPVRVAGRNILSAGYGPQFHLSEDTTGYLEFDGANGMVNTSFSANLQDLLFTIGTDHIFLSGKASANYGLVHTISGTISNKPDLMVTTGNNLLYPSAQYLGVAYKFVATGGTTTSIIVNGQTFYATYGIDSDSGTNKIYNITKKEIYTNTKDNPTDTLEFAATTAPEAGDVFLVFRDAKFTLATSNNYSLHFGNQNTASTWVRQMKFIGSDYWITNGNYIASLNIDMATFSETAKQLPYNTQATCIGENNGMMLVGGDFMGRGKLMLWNTYDSGWLSIIELNKAPSAIVSYKNGWLFVAGAVLYFTDGYQVQEVSKFPDLDNFRTTLNVHYNGMLVVEDKLFISVYTNQVYRARTGVLMYDFSKGWSYSPMVVDTGYKSCSIGTNGCLHYFVDVNGLPVVYSSFKDTGHTANYIINRIYYNQQGEKSVIFYFDLSQKIRVSKVDLKVSFKFDENFYNSTTASVTMNYGDGKRLLYSGYSVGAASDSNTIANGAGATRTPLVGQQIQILGGVTCGERSYISSIANSGTASETWEISPALTTTPTTSSTISVTNLYKSETKTIPATKITDNLTFNVKDFNSDKLYLEFVFNNAERMNLDIIGLNVY